MPTELRYWSRNLVREFGFLNKYYGDTDVTLSETHALLELNRIGVLEVGELSRILNVDKSVASRLLSGMLKKSWVKLKEAKDQRKKHYSLNKNGLKVFKAIENDANLKVNSALNQLSKEEQETARKGIELYAKALKISRLKNEYNIRVIEKKDDLQVAKIVRRSLKEMGFKGPGTAAADETLDYLSQVFVGKKKIYLVAEKDGKVCGGAGIVPLVGGDAKTCELVRMFIDNSARGRGLGQLLIEEALVHAKGFGYEYCYLETTERMKAAQKLYQNNDFDYLDKRMGDTGHFACKVFMGRELV